MAVVPAPSARADDDLLVFAAASLTNAMIDVAAAYTDKTGSPVSISFAASSALARQIENGAPAAIFVSANRLWMDRLQAAGRIVPSSRFDVAGNRLALIAPAASDISVQVSSSLDLAAVLGDRRMAVGDPDHVPAGLYARAALDALGLWAAAEPRLARSGDVRGALALVARGETPLGIVYATDAAISDAVRVVGLFPAESHPPIAYPAALTASAGEGAHEFLRFLAGDAAQAVFRNHGFSPPPGDRLDPAS